MKKLTKNERREAAPCVNPRQNNHENEDKRCRRAEQTSCPAGQRRRVSQLIPTVAGIAGAQSGVRGRRVSTTLQKPTNYPDKKLAVVSPMDTRASPSFWRRSVEERRRRDHQGRRRE